MNCPFCQTELESNLSNGTGYQRCDNFACQFHKMPRYSRNLWQGIVLGERVILAPDIFVEIEHIENRTTIWRLDVVVKSDAIFIPRSIRFDWNNLTATKQKIKMLTTFS